MPACASTKAKRPHSKSDSASPCAVEALERRALLAAAPGVLDSAPGQFTRAGDALYFTAWTSEFDQGLWRSDGTAAGTNQVADLVPTSMTEYAGALYFTTPVENFTALGLWKSDGTPAGTGMFARLTSRFGPAGTVTGTAVMDGVLYVAVDDAPGLASTLWRTDGTAGGTRVVKTFDGPSRMTSALTSLTAVGHTLFFATDPGPYGEGPGAELWASDGTEAGTGRVKDINPGPGDGSSTVGPNWRDWAGSRGGVLLFAAKDGKHGTEPWRSNGIAAGTYLLKNTPARGARPPRRLARRRDLGRR